jgi:hypothetical protein
MIYFSLHNFEKIITDTRKLSDNRIENKGLEKLLRPNKEKTSSLLIGLESIHGTDAEGSQPTTAQSPKASDYRNVGSLVTRSTGHIKWYVLRWLVMVN